MEESKLKKWMSAAGAILAVVGSLALLLYLATYKLDRANVNTIWSGGDKNRASDQSTKNRWLTSSPGWASAVLKLDQEVRAGKTILTYRGRIGRSAIQLDAILLDLNREYVYQLNLDIHSALKAFRVGSDRFKLMSVRKSKIRILHYTGI